MRLESTLGFTASLVLALGGGGTFDCTTEFAVPPLAVLDLGERGRGENGKLAMSFDSSLHKSKYKIPIFKSYLVCVVFNNIYLNTSFSTPSSLKAASQLKKAHIRKSRTESAN